jgi:tetratricopeptide (TPR) repeat protein
MKYLLLLIALITTNLNAQNILKFDKRNVQCENKWIARQMDKDSIYTFGFIYIDSQAGLTFNYEGKFKVDNKGKFNRIKEEPISLKQRLVPNRIALAEIPEDKFKELTIEKEPSWMKFYKGDVNSVEHLYRWGYMYNGYEEIEIALTYLEKAEKINPNFKGLQTELAFSYNALGDFDKAELALQKELITNPNDCYTLKELAYTNTKSKHFEKAKATFDKMVVACSEKKYIQETAHNLAYEYYKIKDKEKFAFWKKEADKWVQTKNNLSDNLDKMEAELDKLK